jgi:PAS domain S-box-containing protein
VSLEIGKLSWIYDLYLLGQNAAQAREDTAGIYQQILEHIVAGFNAKSGSLALLDHSNGNLTIVAGIDLPDGVIGKRVNMGDGVLGWVVQKGDALLLNGDVSSDPRFQLQCKEGGRLATSSAICWPLKIENRTIGGISVSRSISGVVSMNRPDDMSPFTEADLKQGSAILNMVSLVLINMQLLIDQRRRYEELRQFKEVLDHTQEMVFILDPDTFHPLYLNQSVANELGFTQGELLQMDSAKIELLMPYLLTGDLIESLHARERESISLNTTWRRKDGSELPVELSLRIERNNGEKGALVAIVRNINGRKAAYEEQRKRYVEMQKLNAKLEDTHNLMLQSEKMASIGQLAAGVAHEINNPIGYVYSNLGTLEKYVQDAFGMIEQYEQAENAIGNEAVRARLKAAREKLDIEFLKEDLRALMNESKDGITRVKKIVQNLKDFSHVDASDEWHFADLHNGLDSTLNIVSNEIKYKADVVREYGDIPEVECLSSQLNQVFMNLLVNAAHAIEERGTITVRTGSKGDEVWVEVADTGKGIAPEHLKKIFDPFFTTKPVGKGTGLGLSLSYGIIQKHHGRIEVESEPGKGTTFRVWLPVKHTDNPPPGPTEDSALLPGVQDFPI